MMISPRRWCAIVVLLLLCCWGCPARVQAEDTLHGFENDVSHGNDNHNTDNDKHHHESGKDSDDDDSDSTAQLIKLFFNGVGTSGVMSWDRVADPIACRKNNLTPRAVGEPTLPFLRIDANYRPVQPSISAIDMRFEVGYGPLGFQYNYSRYHDYRANDSLAISEEFGLYRMTISTGCELDFGMGQLMLRWR